MAVFLSTFANKVDRKGRVSVPASFRSVLERQASSGLILYPSFKHPCIDGCGDERIQEMVGDYSVWVKNYLDTMSRSYKSLVKKIDDPKQHIVTINQISHELRGQGGIFDYPLITSFGKSLYDATLDSRGKVTENRLKLIEAHIDALRVVFNKRVKGQGGKVGSELLKDIERAVKKYSEAPMGSGPI